MPLPFDRLLGLFGGGGPAGDPARLAGRYGPSSDEIAAFIDRVRAMNGGRTWPRHTS